MAFFLIFFGLILRLATHFYDYAPLAPVLKYLPHIPNFAPIGAMALFGGVYLSVGKYGLDKKFALLVPLLALFIGDIFIGFYSPWIMVSVYGSFLLIGLIGLWLSAHKTAPYILGGTLLGSTLFFIITNFAMWAVPHSLYEHNLAGFIRCYEMALPFWRNTLAGDIFYVGLFFGTMEASILIKNRYLKKEANVVSRVGRKRI